MYIPILSCGSRDYLGRSVVQMSIIIVVEYAGIEEFLLPNWDQDLISQAVVERIQESKLPSEVRSLVRDLQKLRSQRYTLNTRV